MSRVRACVRAACCAGPGAYRRRCASVSALRLATCSTPTFITRVAPTARPAPFYHLLTAPGLLTHTPTHVNTHANPSRLLCTCYHATAMLHINPPHLHRQLGPHRQLHTPHHGRRHGPQRQVR